MMKTTERLVTMNNTMLMQVNGGCVTGFFVFPIKNMNAKIRKLFNKKKRDEKSQTLYQ